MTWIILTLTAAGVETISNLFDRYILKHQAKTPDVLVTIWGYFALLIFCAPALITNSVTTDNIAVITGLFSGICYLIAMHFYYQGLKQEEVSRIIPVLSITPLITLIGATFIFNESHHPIQYLGMTLIIFGIAIEAYDRQKHHLIKKQALLAMITAAIFFAVKNLISKLGNFSNIDPLNSLFWIGIFIFIFSIPLTIKFHSKLSLRKQNYLGEHALAVSIAVAASMIYTSAILIGPASLVAFLHRIQILFVFLISSLIDLFNNKILGEKFVKKAFYQKLLGVLIILIGSFLLI